MAESFCLSVRVLIGMEVGSGYLRIQAPATMVG
jgi:hypothetical protein